MEGLDKAKEKALAVSIESGVWVSVICVMCVLGTGGGEGESRHGPGDSDTRCRNVTENKT